MSVPRVRDSRNQRNICMCMQLSVECEPNYRAMENWTRARAPKQDLGLFAACDRLMLPRISKTIKVYLRPGVLGMLKLHIPKEAVKLNLWRLQPLTFLDSSQTSEGHVKKKPDLNFFQVYPSFFSGDCLMTAGSSRGRSFQNILLPTSKYFDPFSTTTAGGDHRKSKCDLNQQEAVRISGQVVSAPLLIFSNCLSMQVASQLLDRDTVLPQI